LLTQTALLEFQHFGKWKEIQLKNNSRPQLPGTGVNVSRPNRSWKTGSARIVIVDDHPMVRERLEEVIYSQPDLEVCG